MNDKASLDLAIRPEQPGDRDAIYDLTKRAFAPMPYAGGDEQDLINALRDAGALACSLIAEMDGALIGHIAFSPAFSSDQSTGWFALGPVSVEPDWQGKGVGAQLIENGLDSLRARNAVGCVLVGSTDYYPRFGFQPAPQNCPDGEPAEFYQILPLAGAMPDGVVDFHPAFHAGQD